MFGFTKLLPSNDILLCEKTGELGNLGMFLVRPKEVCATECNLMYAVQGEAGLGGLPDDLVSHAPLVLRWEKKKRITADPGVGELVAVFSHS